MSYQALYRVWRPQRFSDLVGQELITKTLKNAIATHQTSHAYLFTGPRGTGKTSAAKIFAKAINCHHQKDGEPCNQCETCKAITAGRLNDVIEIDAASNNGVEEIRDIRDKVKYAPTQADYKIYIIDEVHMLSTGAFNALLKTLEEPPENVVFILATTEPHKIPATIISRTQRFDFKRITAKAILGRMEYILDQKEVDYDPQALKIIAKAAEGGMRDALSILDQALSFGQNKVTVDDALTVTGSVTRQDIHNYLEQVIEHKAGQALETVQKILQDGKDANRLIEDLIIYCRDLLLYQEAPEVVEESELGMIDDDFKQFAQQTSPDLLYRMIDVLNEQQENMRFTTHASIYLEVLTVKLSQLDSKKQPQVQSQVAAGPEIKQLESEISRLQDEVRTMQNELANRPAGRVSQAQPARTNDHGSQNTDEPKHIPVTKVKVNLDRVYAVLENATKKDIVDLRQAWKQMLQQLSVPNRAIMNMGKPLAASPDKILIGFKQTFICKKAIADQQLQENVAGQLKPLLGHAPGMVLIPLDQWQGIRNKYVVRLHDGKAGKNKVKSKADNASAPAEENQQAEEKKEAPVVAEANKLFGKDIVKVKKD